MTDFYRPRNPTPSAAMFNHRLVDDLQSFQSDTCDLDVTFEAIDIYEDDDDDSVFFDDDVEEPDCDLSDFIVEKPALIQPTQSKPAFPVFVAHRSSDYSPSYAQLRPRNPTPRKALYKGNFLTVFHV